MSQVRKAVITAAGRGTRQYPASNVVQKELFPLVDTDGFTKPTLQIIVEEALNAGLEEICIVANPSNVDEIRRHFQAPTTAQRESMRGKEWATPLLDRLADMSQRISFVVQETQEGYGHAVYQTKDWVGDEAFVLLLGDHVYLAPEERNCTQQVVDVWNNFGQPVSSVAQVPEAVITRFGTLNGTLIDGHPGAYKITEMIEKPTIETARERLRAPGIPEGEYLCFFGIHVFPPVLFDCIGHLIKNDIRDKKEIQLTSAQTLLLNSVDTYIAATVNGTRFDMGVPEGLVETQIALALNSPFRDRVYSTIHEVEPLVKARTGA
ncbi:MAG TPA: sugar phosphate nucleotidyltransferase [Capsulimonadaceae bacterium]|jgi:UTP--glucose-1-phosphate uridylyltransferase